MEIQQLKSTSAGVQAVIKEIDHLMNTLYPEIADIMLPMEEIDLPNVYFVGIYVEEVLAACGAVISKYDREKYGEFKRIYVKPEYRGMGLSKKIISHFVTDASMHGYQYLRLETGFKQLAAIALYTSFGFKERNVFGDYGYDPEAMYMELPVNL